MTTWKQELDVFNERSKDANIFCQSARDHTTKFETEEGHKLIEDIDNVMKKFNSQQIDFPEARVSSYL